MTSHTMTYARFEKLQARHQMRLHVLANALHLKWRKDLIEKLFALTQTVAHEMQSFRLKYYIGY